MSWVMAGVAVVGGGIKLYQGYQQKKKGEAAEAAAERDKPDDSIPQEILQNQKIAEQMARQGIPEEQRRKFIEDQQRASQSALRSSSDRRGGLGIISQIQGTEDRSSLGLLQQDVQARKANMMTAMQSRETVANYKQKRFEHQYNEYSADLDYARGQIGAGMQNQQAGMDQMISGAGQGVAGYAGGGGFSPEGYSNPQLKTSIGNDPTQNQYVEPTQVQNSQLGTGFQSGSLNAQNYSSGLKFNSLTGKFA
tara:strand:+ start:1340 stop:2092 length:753 start_codon:yes stop_codon:yes gene_type:complete